MTEQLGYRFRPPIHQRWRRIERRNIDLQWLERGVVQARKIADRGPQLVCLAAFLPFLALAASRELAEELVSEVQALLTGAALQFVVARIGPALSPHTLARLVDWLLPGPQLKSSVQCLATIVDQLEPAHARCVADSIMNRSGWLFESEACLVAIDAFADHLSDAEHPRLVAVAGKLRSPEDRAVALVRVASVVSEPLRSRLLAAAQRCYAGPGDERPVGRRRVPTTLDRMIRSTRQLPDFDSWVRAHSVQAFAREVAPDLGRILTEANEGAPRFGRLRDQLVERTARADTSDATARDGWNNGCVALASGERPAALVGLTFLAPVIYRLGGSQAALGTVTAVQEVAGWWP